MARCAGRDQIAAASQSEVVRSIRTAGQSRRRSGSTSSRAEREIGLLVYAGMFLAEDAGVQKLLAAQARAGVGSGCCSAIRTAEVAERGDDEGIGDEAMAAKVRNSLVLFRRLLPSRAEFRLHGTVLYNSIFRADDQLLVNTHIYGSGELRAGVPPAQDRRRRMVSTYLDSFERVWESATPLARERVSRRIDYHDDPAAPAANSLVPSVNVMVTNEQGSPDDPPHRQRQLGTSRRRYRSGGVDAGRGPRDPGGDRDRLRDHRAGRHLHRPPHVIRYTSNDEVRQEFSIVLTARPAGTDAEQRVIEVRWVPREDLGRLSDGPVDAATDPALPGRAQRARRTWGELATAVTPAPTIYRHIS